MNDDSGTCRIVQVSTWDDNAATKWDPNYGTGEPGVRNCAETLANCNDLGRLPTSWSLCSKRFYPALLRRRSRKCSRQVRCWEVGLQQWTSSGTDLRKTEHLNERLLGCTSQL